MPSPRPPGPYPIDGATMPTWLVRFDADGRLASPGTADALVNHLRGADYSNVLFYSHGWNTDFADALDQYGRFLAAFAHVIGEHPIPGFRPIFAGVIWPSVWIAADTGPVMASVGADAAAEIGVVAEIAASLPEAERDRLYALADAPSLTRPEALDLARLLAPKAAAEDELGEAEPAPEAEDILASALALAEAERAVAIPLGEPVDLDPMGAPPAVVTGALDAIDPRNILRLFSLYQMKDRAGRVGANGVAALLRRMQAATAAKINVFGHSFGAKVMLSAIAAPAPLPRKVDTLLLLQPAISHLAFAAEVPGRPGPGGYRVTLDRVAAPIFSTFSAMDQPLHDVFHLALRRAADLGEARIAAAGEPPGRYAALGGYGPRGAGEHLLDPIPAPGTAYGDPGAARIVGLDGSGGRITSHGDVANGYTAWALRRLIVGPA